MELRFSNSLFLVCGSFLCLKPQPLKTPNLFHPHPCAPVQDAGGKAPPAALSPRQPPIQPSTLKNITNPTLKTPTPLRAGAGRWWQGPSPRPAPPATALSGAAGRRGRAGAVPHPGRPGAGRHSQHAGCSQCTSVPRPPGAPHRPPFDRRVGGSV